MRVRQAQKAPIRLPYLEDSECNFQMVQLEYEQARAQQDGHMQYAHGAVARAQQLRSCHRTAIFQFQNCYYTKPDT